MPKPQALMNESLGRPIALGDRALASKGTSNNRVIYDRAVEALRRLCPRGGTLVDAGCGVGTLHSSIESNFDRYIGIDCIRHEGFPSKAELILANLEDPNVTLPDLAANAVCCLETIEHVENPRALFRTIVKLLRPGGTLVVSTPNQLSWLSKLSLLVKGEFVHFQERPGLYPAHLTALLEVDLLRMARENGLTDVSVVYSGEGRMPGTSRHWPSFLGANSGWRGRGLSDNVLLTAKKA